MQTLSTQVAAYFQDRQSDDMPNSQKASVVSAKSDRLTRRPLVLFCLPRIRLRRSDFRHSVKSIFFRKEYLAVVVGYLPEDPADLWHTISFPVKKVSDHPLRMQAVPDPNDNCHADASLLPAVTHYCTLYSTANWSLVSLRLDTGRTHQIRVHMKALGHPLLGDTLYYNKSRLFFLYSHPLPALPSMPGRYPSGSHLKEMRSG